MPKLLRVTTSPLSLRSLLPNQMRFMKENGFEVIMVSSTGKEWPSILENEQCEHRIVPMARNIAPLKDLRSLWLLYRLIKKEKPDIVHSHTPKAGLLAMLAAKFAGVRLRIHTIAGLRFMTATGMLKRILVFMEKLTARAATHVWPNSYSLLEYIRTNKLVKESKLHVIGYGSSNGVDLQRFSVSALKQEHIEEVKKLIGFEANNTYLLSMGRIVKDKGIEELVPAFATLQAAQPSLRLVLLGQYEDHLDPVNAKTKELIKTHPAIIHIEWNEKVEYFMHVCQLMVHASYREGFPNTLLQAGAMECPVVCSRIEGNIDIVTNGETGILFNSRDEKDLAGKLQWAILHPSEMKKYAIELRKKVEKHFSQRHVHNSLKEKYLELLNKGA
jgi:glycosyltransferase involved in cell wall biosynthesis